jgi:small conductance mechanosensitive channel
LDKAVRLALEAVKNVRGVLEDPAPQVIVTELADSSVNLSVRVWARKEDWGSVREAVLKSLYKVYGENGIEIPYPQLDVHVRDMPSSQK